MSRINARTFIRVLSAVSFAAIASWLFTTRSAGPLPARSVSPKMEVDADGPIIKV